MMILTTYVIGFLVYWLFYSSFIRACGLAIASSVIQKRKNSMVAEIFSIYKPNRLFSLIYLPLIFPSIMFFALKKIYKSQI